MDDGLQCPYFTRTAPALNAVVLTLEECIPGAGQPWVDMPGGA